MYPAERCCDTVLLNFTFYLNLDFFLYLTNRVWFQHGQSNQENSTALVQGYLDRGIPVGCVNIDSEWATYFNNFEVDTNKYPDLRGFVKTMHDQQVKVTMWATSMVNTDNPEYEEAKDRGYLVRDGKGVVRPIKWWKGYGALLDYANPEALAWWHTHVDKVLNIDNSGDGIDGFKTDQTDLYIAEYIALSGAALSYDNHKYTYREYANYYYRDFLYYTREVKGDDSGLIMSRPMDCALDRITKVCNPSSPYDVMYSGWVGDDDATFNGLTGALRKVIYSAWNNYTNVGFDIGGYRDVNDGGTIKEVFIRWVQLGAFVPLMENGGGGEHRPWMIDEETVDIYRKFVLEHYRLIPYLMTAGTESMESNGTMPVITPLAIKETEDYFNPQPTTYSYLLGDDILVHPVLNDKNVVEMTFPSGAETWLSWWNPSSRRAAVDGLDAEEYVMHAMVALDSFPVYVRRNALLPLDLAPATAVDEETTLLFTWFCPIPSEELEEAATKTATVREAATVGNGMVSTVSLSADGAFFGSVSAHLNSRQSVGFQLIGVTEPSNISFEPANAGCTHTWSSASDTLEVVCSDLSGGLIVNAKGVYSNF